MTSTEIRAIAHEVLGTPPTAAAWAAEPGRLIPLAYKLARDALTSTCADDDEPFFPSLLGRCGFSFDAEQRTWSWKDEQGFGLSFNEGARRPFLYTGPDGEAVALPLPETVGDFRYLCAALELDPFAEQTVCSGGEAPVTGRELTPRRADELQRLRDWSKRLAEAEARVLADQASEQPGYFSEVYDGTGHCPDFDMAALGSAYLWVAERLRRLLACRGKYGGCGAPACNVGGGPCADCGQAAYALQQELAELVSPTCERSEQ